MNTSAARGKTEKTHQGWCGGNCMIKGISACEGPAIYEIQFAIQGEPSHASPISAAESQDRPCVKKFCPFGGGGGAQAQAT